MSVEVVRRMAETKGKGGIKAAVRRSGKARDVSPESDHPLSPWRHPLDARNGEGHPFKRALMILSPFSSPDSTRHHLSQMVPHRSPDDGKGTEGMGGEMAVCDPCRVEGEQDIQSRNGYRMDDDREQGESTTRP